MSLQCFSRVIGENCYNTFLIGVFFVSFLAFRLFFGETTQEKNERLRNQEIAESYLNVHKKSLEDFFCNNNDLMNVE